MFVDRSKGWSHFCCVCSKRGIGNVSILATTVKSVGDVRTLARQGRIKEAIRCLNQEHIHVKLSDYVCLLRSCGSAKAFLEGRIVHAHIIKCALQQDSNLGDRLVEMYHKCESLQDACEAFDNVHNPSVISWNRVISAYVQNGQGKDALQILAQMRQQQIEANKVTFITILNAHVYSITPAEVKVVHAHAYATGYESDAVVGTSLINIYGRCKNHVKARAVFDKISEKDVISWNAMLGTYVKHGDARNSFELFCQMVHECIKPDRISFITALSCPMTLQEIRYISKYIVYNDYESHSAVIAALITAYSKCGSLEDAHAAFDKLPKKNVISWTSMIGAYSRSTISKHVFELFEAMQEECISPDEITFINMIDASTSLEAGKLVHAHTIRNNFNTIDLVRTVLISMYSKCGNVSAARMVFDKGANENIVMWNAMLSAYAHQGFRKETMMLFHQLILVGLQPDNITFMTSLEACCAPVDVMDGKLVHAFSIECMFDVLEYVGTALVNMYSNCGNLDDACRVFFNMDQLDLMSWNTIVAAHMKHGHVREALQLFQQMVLSGAVPDKVTFVCVLGTFSDPISLTGGILMHAFIIHSRVEFNIVLYNAVINMYGKCGFLSGAQSVFDSMPLRDVISWNALIAAFIQNGHEKEALKIFHHMFSVGTCVDTITFIAAFNACSHSGVLAEGKLIHAYMVDKMFTLDTVVGNALVNMYGRSGSADDATIVFECMHQRNVGSWNAMIAAYSYNGQNMKALQSFREARQEGLQLDMISFINTADACSSIAAFMEGKLIHTLVICSQPELDVVMGTALVNMYGKCGCIADAQKVFDNMSDRNVMSWNAILVSYAQYGYGDEALNLFWHMHRDAVKPDSISFIGVLSACSHAGKIDEGIMYFLLMSKTYNIVPAIASFGCLLDLLGRSGSLDEADDFFNEMPVRPNLLVCVTFLGACRMHGDMQRGKYAAELVLEFDPLHAAAFITLSNICVNLA